MLTFAEDSNSGAAEPVSLRRPGKSDKEPPTRIKILRPAEDQADHVQRNLRVPLKSSFKRLILETLLWQYAMSSNLKFPTRRPQALGMQKREVSCLTSYPICSALGPNWETGIQAEKGQDAWWNQLQDGRFPVRD